MATICNMGATTSERRVGATTSVFPFNPQMGAYLAATGRGDIATLAQRYSHLLTPDEGCVYDRVIEINLDELGPHINGPFTPDLCTAVADMPERSKKEGWPNAVSSCLIGSCTNSSFEDMAKAAHLTKQALDAGLKFKVPFYVTPGSVAVAKAIEAEGFTAIFEEAGGVVLAKACGPCIGQCTAEGAARRQGVYGAHAQHIPPSLPHTHLPHTYTPYHPYPPSPSLQNTIITSYNRNFAKKIT